jgi:hypothetical protein
VILSWERVREVRSGLEWAGNGLSVDIRIAQREGIGLNRRESIL